MLTVEAQSRTEAGVRCVRSNTKRRWMDRGEGDLSKHQARLKLLNFPLFVKWKNLKCRKRVQEGSHGQCYCMVTWSGIGETEGSQQSVSVKWWQMLRLLCVATILNLQTILGAREGNKRTSVANVIMTTEINIIHVPCEILNCQLNCFKVKIYYCFFKAHPPLVDSICLSWLLLSRKPWQSWQVSWHVPGIDNR